MSAVPFYVPSRHAAPPAAAAYAVMPMPIVEELAASDHASWDAYALRDPRATLYHLHAWRPIAQRVYDIDAPFLVARDRACGPIRGILPLFRVARPFAPCLTNGLLGSYADALADDLRYARALARAAVDRFDGMHAHDLRLTVLGESVCPSRRVLGADQEASWNDLSPATRTKIRHAQKSGLVARRDGDLDGFYDVLSERALRTAAWIEGRRFFEELLGELGARANVLTLRKGGRVVGGALLAWVNGVMHVASASVRPGSLGANVNPLLAWETVRYAHALGLDAVDFGRSMRESTGLERGVEAAAVERATRMSF